MVIYIYSFTMKYSNCMLIIFLVVSLVEVITGQSAARYTLCRDKVVTVSPGSSGVIQHLQKNSSYSTSCVLALRGFREGSNVSLLNLDVKRSYRNCLLDVSINNSSYCVNKNRSYNNVIIQLRSEELVVHLKSHSVANFTFQFYNSGE